MSERAAYSRVYWALVDDDKFVGIYNDDHHLATWLRLLLMADQSHPASSHLPHGVRRSSVQALVSAGLVDVLPDSRFRIHGLDAERERRRAAATSRGTGRGPDGDQTVPEREPTGIQTPGLRRGGDEVEPRKDEGARTPRQLVHAWLAEHGAAAPTGWVIGTLNELVKVYGAERVIELWGNAPKDVRTSKQYVQFAERGLSPTATGSKSSGGHTRSEEEGERAFAR